MKAPLQCVFEDAYLIAVNKPAGLPVHDTVDPLRPSLQSLLEKQVGKKLVLFHRLDLDTTGLVLLGKDPSINTAMTDLFRNRAVEKTYWCVVDGRWLESLEASGKLYFKASGGKVEKFLKEFFRSYRWGSARADAAFRCSAAMEKKLFSRRNPKLVALIKFVFIA